MSLSRLCPTCGQVPPIDSSFVDASRRWRLVCATEARRRDVAGPGSTSRRPRDSRSRVLALVPRSAGAPRGSIEAVHTARVRDSMSAAIVLVRASTPVPEARRLMRHYKVRHLPVMRGERLVGIVTDHDLLLGPPGRAGAGRVAETERRLATSQVREVMSRPVITIGPDETIGRAAGLMFACKVRCLPVVDGDRLVGILTATDLLHAIAAADRMAKPTRT